MTGQEYAVEYIQQKPVIYIFFPSGHGNLSLDNVFTVIVPDLSLDNVFDVIFPDLLVSCSCHRVLLTVSSEHGAYLTHAATVSSEHGAYLTHAVTVSTVNMVHISLMQ